MIVRVMVTRQLRMWAMQMRAKQMVSRHSVQKRQTERQSLDKTGMTIHGNTKVLLYNANKRRDYRSLSGLVETVKSIIVILFGYAANELSS